MKEREYRKLRAKIECEYRENLQALDLVFKMSGGDAAEVGAATPLPMGELAKAVRGAVDAQGSEFTVRNIEDAILESNPDYRGSINRTSISSALKRLVNDVIVVKQLGRGKRATRYEKRQTPDTTGDATPSVSL